MLTCIVRERFISWWHAQNYSTSSRIRQRFLRFWPIWDLAQKIERNHQWVTCWSLRIGRLIIFFDRFYQKFTWVLGWPWWFIKIKIPLKCKRTHLSWIWFKHKYIQDNLIKLTQSFHKKINEGALIGNWLHGVSWHLFPLHGFTISLTSERYWNQE